MNRSIAALLLAASSLLACASSSAARNVDARIAKLELRADVFCQRFEELQKAQLGRIAHPCRLQDATVTLTPVYVHVTPGPSAPPPPAPLPTPQPGK